MDPEWSKHIGTSFETTRTRRLTVGLVSLLSPLLFFFFLLLLTHPTFPFSLHFACPSLLLSILCYYLFRSPLSHPLHDSHPHRRVQGPRCRPARQTPVQVKKRRRHRFISSCTVVLPVACHGHHVSTPPRSMPNGYPFCLVITPRNGADPRAIPKKAGAGHGNWGVPGCELDDQDQSMRYERKS
jgi:hypothetical protein